METYSEYVDNVVANVVPNERARFIRRTYGHLAGAMIAFVGLEFLLFQTALPGIMMNFLSTGRFGWLMFLGAFILIGWMARGFAAKTTSVGAQYFGLGLYVVAEAIIFLPLLFIAANYSTPDVIPTAGILTLLLFLGLTLVAFTTRKDFSFLGPILMMGGFVALGLIVCGAIFGFTLGLAFSGGMILLACGAILYDTSKVIHHFRPNQHVAASLELFASIALLFWYVLRLLMQLNRR